MRKQTQNSLFCTELLQRNMSPRRIL